MTRAGLAVAFVAGSYLLKPLSLSLPFGFKGFWCLNDAGNGDILKELHKDRALISSEVSTGVNHMNKWNVPMCRVHHKRKRTWRPDGPKEIHLRAL